MIDSTEGFTGEFVSVTGSSLHLFETPGARLSDAHWSAAVPLDAFIDNAEQHRDLWQTTRRLAHLTDAQRDAAVALSTACRLLVLLEDWCGDAIHTVPVVLRLVEANPLLALRVLRRDEHDDLMDRHLTGTARAIPVIMAFDATGHERGWWGPRPTALQKWVQLEGLSLEKADRYKAIRTWYARDRGATTSAEVLRLLQHTTTG
jgi:hypothetical protein